MRRSCCSRGWDDADRHQDGVDDQFAGLSAQSFAGRNMRALPFDSVDDLMESLEDLALNQTRATASVRLSGGGDHTV